MPRDSQRQAVYDWESALDSKFNMTRNCSILEAEQVVLRIWRDYGMAEYGNISIPKIRRPPGKRNRDLATASWDGRLITLPDWALNLKTVIHETAHCMIFQMDGRVNNPSWKKQHIAHGKLFATLLLELYERYLGLDRVAARQMGIHQKPRRVRFATQKYLHAFFWVRHHLPRAAACKLIKKGK